MGYEQFIDSIGEIEDKYLQHIPFPTTFLRRKLGQLHLAMPYSNNADIAPDGFRTSNPELPSVSLFESAIGITPSMKANDAINDRNRQFLTTDNKRLVKDATRYGVETKFNQDGNSGYRTADNIRADLEGLTEAIQALSKDDGTDPINMRRLGLTSLSQRTVKDEDGVERIEPITPADIRDLAGAYRTRRDVTSKLTSLGVTPQKGASLPQLQQQLRAAEVEREKDNVRITDEAKYGTLNADGTRTGGTASGRMELDAAQDTLDTNKSNRAVAAQQIESSKNSDARDTLITNQNIAQQNYTNKRNAWEYDQNLKQLQKEREYNLAVKDAEYAARTKEIQMQNDADMERYQLMLQNDREVRRGDTISDLMASLTMLGGAFMI